MHVVIIDDNKANLLLCSSLVSSLEGCEAHSFDDPVAALDWCRGHATDLVLVDYMMPEIDGLEFISRFRGMDGKTDVPTVMVTTADLKEVRLEALRRGATDFVTKPIDVTEFTARITNLLALRRSQLHLRDHAAWLAEEVAKATRSLVERENEVIFRLSRAAEYRDPETGEHIARIAHISRLIARGVGLPEEDQDMVFRAAPMHDVGKVGIADDILLKPGKLTPEEFQIMKQHTVVGHAILRDSPSRLLQVAAVIARSHHEKFDGTGYPDGLAGEAIPIYGRIVAVADVFDALTSARPYKKPWPVEQAIDYIREGSNGHFDPRAVGAFFAGLDEILEIRKRYNE
jgi:putative two-component system response regulator